MGDAGIQKFPKPLLRIAAIRRASQCLVSKASGIQKGYDSHLLFTPFLHHGGLHHGVCCH